MELPYAKSDPSGRHRIAGLLPVAGLSRRMGDFKPLLPLRGRTVVENSVDSLLAAGAGQVVVVLGYRGDEVESVLRASYPAGQVIFARNADYATTDMLASIKLGAAALPACDAFFLLPADMPVVGPDTCRAVVAAMPFGARKPHVVFPTVDGWRKHPPLIDSRLVPGILDYQGPGGLRGFWQRHEDAVITVPVDDPGCCTDLDTPQQYQRCVRFFSNHVGTREAIEWKQSLALS